MLNLLNSTVLDQFITFWGNLYFKTGAGISQWGNNYYKLRQLHTIAMWGKNCYKAGQIIYNKLGQSLLQSGAFVAAEGALFRQNGAVNAKWGNTQIKGISSSWSEKFIALSHCSQLPTWHESEWRHMFTNRVNVVLEQSCIC